ncbi:MAG: DHH family phosphoesterase [Patescibacteria group bacterium]|jgi:inorganic pyrophosphatase/exopolyphosphatase
MSQVVVTTGKRFTDIDALACVIAYKEILPTPVIAVIPGSLNQSVTKDIRLWPLDYQKTLDKNPEYSFVIVDVSEDSQLPSFVNKEKIIEIYDHHFGFEKIWQERLGGKAKIEEIGACATLIWEEFKSRNPEKKISTLAANLLYTAIFSNTLNFQASLTSPRDQKAFDELRSLVDLPADWIPQYYQDQELQAYLNTQRAVFRDTKIQFIKGMKCAVGQMELWNSENFIKEKKDEIALVLKSFETEHWMLISPSISEGRDYIFTKSQLLKDLLSQSMRIDFFGTDVGVTDKLWIRKEILKKVQ